MTVVLSFSWARAQVSWGGQFRDDVSIAALYFDGYFRRRGSILSCWFLVVQIVQAEAHYLQQQGQLEDVDMVGILGCKKSGLRRVTICEVVCLTFSFCSWCVANKLLKDGDSRPDILGCLIRNYRIINRNTGLHRTIHKLKLTASQSGHIQL